MFILGSTLALPFQISLQAEENSEFKRVYRYGWEGTLLIKVSQ